MNNACHALNTIDWLISGSRVEQIMNWYHPGVFSEWKTVKQINVKLSASIQLMWRIKVSPCRHDRWSRYRIFVERVRFRRSVVYGKVQSFIGSAIAIKATCHSSMNQKDGQTRVGRTEQIHSDLTHSIITLLILAQPSPRVPWLS